MTTAIRRLLFLILTVPCAFAAKDQYADFMSRLTYPSSEWSADDFGRKATDREKELLARFAPEFWVKKGSCRPMDFYEQYVPLLQLRSDEEEGIGGSRKALKRFERDFETEWSLSDAPDCIENQKPPLYAISWRETMVLPGSEREHPVRVLKYTFTFYKSGLPAKQSFIQKAGWILGNQEKWHYLDIHGAVFYLLDEKDELFSVVLAQHNHFRSYIVGVDVSPEDARRICYAVRSNEPYFCGRGEKTTFQPTAATFRYMEWIVSGKNKPFLGAWDEIPGASEREPLAYKFDFLSHRDPLITSWVSLGPALKIWGVFSTFYRDSPPGMAIFNLPDLKPIWKTAQAFYFDPEDKKTFDIHEENSRDFLGAKIEPVFGINSVRYAAALKKAGWF